MLFWPCLIYFATRPDWRLMLINCYGLVEEQGSPRSLAARFPPLDFNNKFHRDLSICHHFSVMDLFKSTEQISTDKRLSEERRPWEAFVKIVITLWSHTAKHEKVPGLNLQGKCQFRKHWPKHDEWVLVKLLLPSLELEKQMRGKKDWGYNKHKCLSPLKAELFCRGHFPFTLPHSLKSYWKQRLSKCFQPVAPIHLSELHVYWWGGAGVLQKNLTSW